jgi:hypothetical protein
VDSVAFASRLAIRITSKWVQGPKFEFLHSTAFG